MPRTAMHIRSTVLSLRELDYVQAARGLGRSDTSIGCRHILPNCIAPLLMQGSFIFAYALQEVFGQRRDVLGPVAQRRQSEREDVEPIVQVLAEVALAPAVRAPRAVPCGRDLGQGPCRVQGRTGCGVLGAGCTTTLLDCPCPRVIARLPGPRPRKLSLQTSVADRASRAGGGGARESASIRSVQTGSPSLRMGAWGRRPVRTRSVAHRPRGGAASKCCVDEGPSAQRARPCECGRGDQ
jgi:hypothetical protein